MKILRRKFLKLSYFFSLIIFSGLLNFRSENKKKYVWYLNKSDK